MTLTITAFQSSRDTTSAGGAGGPLRSSPAERVDRGPTACKLRSTDVSCPEGFGRQQVATWRVVRTDVGW